MTFFLFERPIVQRFFSHVKSQFHEIRFLRNKKFFANTKHVSHEIHENFIRKKLECQPHVQLTIDGTVIYLATFHQRNDSWHLQ